MGNRKKKNSKRHKDQKTATYKKAKILAVLLTVAMLLVMGIGNTFITSAAGVTVYYDFVQKTSIPNTGGITYLFLKSGLTAPGTGDCLTSVPAGSALLEYDTSLTGTSVSGAVNVKVIQAGSGFDSCAAGTLLSYEYSCNAGGVKHLGGRAFTYKTKNITANDIKVSLKSGVAIPTGNKTLAKSDIVVEITTEPGKSYIADDYTFQDSVVNFRAGDNQIQVNFGGVIVKKVVDMTGLSKKVWEEDNKTIIEKNTVTAADIAAINKAISDGEANLEVTEADLTALRNKLPAAQWHQDNATALGVTNPTVYDYDALKAAKESYNSLSPAVQAYISTALPNQIETNYKGAEDLVVAGGENFVKTYMSDPSGNKYPAVNRNNIDQIMSGQTPWTGLTAAEQRVVNGNLAGVATYPGFVSMAQNFAEQSAKAFTEAYTSDGEGKPLYTTVTTSNIDRVLSGTTDWDAHFETEKAAINKKLTDAGGKTYPNMILDANKLADDNAKKFVKDFVADAANNVYASVTTGNIDQIMSGRTTWDAFSQTEKDVVDKKLTDAGSKAYLTLITEAEAFAANSAKQFAETYVADSSKNIYTAVNTGNIDQILSGKTAWNALSQTEKDALDKKLTDAGSKAYSILITEAEAFADANAKQFAETHVADSSKNIYTAVTTGNIDQIMGGKAAWDGFSNTEKAALDKKLTDAGSKAYSTLITEAEAFADANAKQFVSSFTSDGAGIIYTSIDRKNIDQVLSGGTTWDALSQTEKNAINAKHAAGGGKTYEAMVIEADKFAEDNAKQFVSSYVTDGNGVIYNGVDRDNIDQIMSGAAIWDTLSQAEKNVINDKLVKAGGKTFEDIIREADAFTEQSSNGFVSGYVSDGGGLIYTGVDRNNIDQILSGEDEWNAMSQTEQNAVNDKLAKAGGKTYGDMIKDAEKFAEESGESFVSSYVSDGGGLIYTTVDRGNIDQIMSGGDEWDKMSQAEKDEVNKKLVKAGGKPYEDMIKEAEKVAEETGNGFVSSYVSDGGGLIYTTVNKDNIDQIMSGLEDWNSFSQTEKDAIDKKLTGAGGKAYEDMIKEAEKLAEESGNGFIASYLSDGGGLIYTKVDRNNIKQILSGEGDWESLSQTEKDSINDRLVKAGGKPYEEMLKEAETFVEESGNNFIATYVSDGGGLIYTKVTKDNIDQILSGTGEWDVLSQPEKDAINDKLVKAGGMPYEDMIKEAEKIAEESGNKFIATYVSDGNGVIYTTVTKDNIDQIISGAAEWDTLTQAEKDAINDKLVKAGGMPYEDMIKEAEKLAEEGGNDFIEKYLSDAGGLIYTTVTKDNIEQIQSGIEDWNKLTQAEKDAINDKLVKAGGKPYEDMIKEAEALAEELIKEFVALYVSDRDEIIYKEVTRSNINQILSGKEAWYTLSLAEQEAINNELLKASGKTYEEMIAETTSIPKMGDPDKMVVWFALIVISFGILCSVCLSKKKLNINK